MINLNAKEEYISWIKGQLEYFDKKSISEKKKYTTLSICAIVANAIIPIITVFSTTNLPLAISIATLSAISAILTGTSLQLNAKNNWLHYRNCYTDLERSLRAYNMQAGEYLNLSEGEALALFFNRCEDILAEDRRTWEPEAEKTI